MITLVFYVVMCSIGVDGKESCDGFEPMSWTYQTESERTQAFKECFILVNAYNKLEAVKEVDCYIEE